MITLFSFLFAVFAVAISELTDQQIDAATKVAVCRAHCIDGFSHRFLSLSNSQCESDADCFMCWENCEMFYRSFDIWGSICNDPIVCFDGCQLACAVYKDPSKLSQKTDPWSFSKSVSVNQNVRSGYVNVEWSQPMPIYSTEPPLPHVVFVLFWYNVEGWVQVNQTISTSYFTKNSQIVTDRSIKLLILAVTREGVVGQLKYSKLLYDQQRTDSLSFTTAGSYFSRPNKVGSSSDVIRTDISFIVGTVAAAIVTGLLLIFGTIFGWKIVKEQRRKYLLRRANALKIKRSVRNRYRDSRSLNGSNVNLLKIETVSKICADKDEATSLDPTHSHWANLNVFSFSNENEIVSSKPQVIKVDSNLPFVLTIVERPQGIDEVIINHGLLKKKLEEQNSIIV